MPKERALVASFNLIVARVSGQLTGTSQMLYLLPGSHERRACLPKAHGSSCFNLSGLFLHPTTSNELSVDTTRGETLQINVSHPVFTLSPLIATFTHSPLIAFVTYWAVVPSVQMDVTFPNLACSVLSLDAMDISGEQHLDVVMWNVGTEMKGDVRPVYGV